MNVDFLQLFCDKKKIIGTVVFVASKQVDRYSVGKYGYTASCFETYCDKCILCVFSLGMVIMSQIYQLITDLFT